MAEADQGDRVSREAHERVTRERDQAMSRVKELEAVVQDVGIRDKARSFFKEKGHTDPDWAAEMSLPHLRDTSLDEIPNVLAGDRFSRFLAVSGSSGEPPAPATDPVAVEPAASGFTGGPNPAGGGQPPSPSKISPNSPEFKEAVARNDRALLQDWDNKGMIEWHPDVLAQEGANA